MKRCDDTLLWVSTGRCFAEATDRLYETLQWERRFASLRFQTKDISCRPVQYKRTEIVKLRLGWASHVVWLDKRVIQNVSEIISRKSPNFVEVRVIVCVCRGLAVGQEAAVVVTLSTYNQLSWLPSVPTISCCGYPQYLNQLLWLPSVPTISCFVYPQYLQSAVVVTLSTHNQLLWLPSVPTISCCGYPQYLQSAVVVTLSTHNQLSWLSSVPTSRCREVTQNRPANKRATSFPVYYTWISV